MGEADVEERRKALEKKFVEKRPPLAYAKLVGRVLDDQPFEALVTHLPVDLGRGPVGGALRRVVTTLVIKRSDQS